MTTNATEAKKRQLMWMLEAIWWIVTAIVVVVVLFPIYSSLNNYPFYPINIIFIVTFITLARYIFLLKFTALANRQTWKIIIVFLCIPVVFLLVQELNAFQLYIDEEGIDALVGELPYDEKDNMISYIRSQMLLFATGSVICSVLLPFRLVISVWRTRNRGTV
jgi:energy-coupling factor transporter transmembrane protein EcfT